MPRKGYSSISLPDPMINEIAIEIDGDPAYSSRADFIKDSIRRNLDRVRGKKKKV